MIILFFFKFIYIYFLFLAVLGLRFCARAFSNCSERGPLFIAVRGPLTVVASPVAEHRLQTPRRAGSVVVAHGLSRSAACGIFPDQGSNPCPLHWQADSQPLRHQGSPICDYSFGSVVLKVCSVKYSNLTDPLKSGVHSKCKRETNGF